MIIERYCDEETKESKGMITPLCRAKKLLQAQYCTATDVHKIVKVD